jgi:hypothetical protein
MRIKHVLIALFLLSCFALSHAESKTVVFQQGVDDYTGCEDQELRDPSKNYRNGPNEDKLLINEW